MDTSLLEVPDRIDITGFYILWEPGFCCEYLLTRPNALKVKFAIVM
jgi:hypothetical protein